MRSLVWLVLAAVSALSFAAFGQPTPSRDPWVGQRAPRVVLRQPDGREIDTHSLAGRPYVLDFWSPHCGPCRGYVPRLNAAHQRLARAGGAVLGVLSFPLDDRAHGQLRRAWRMRYPSGTPVPGRDESERYQVTRLPVMVAVGADGLVRFGARDRFALDRLLLSAELVATLRAPFAAP